MDSKRNLMRRRSWPVWIKRIRAASLARIGHWVGSLFRTPGRRRTGLLVCLLFSVALIACSAPVKVERVDLTGILALAWLFGVLALVGIAVGTLGVIDPHILQLY